MKKKILTALLTFALSFAMITGCGSASNEADSSGSKTETPDDNSEKDDDAEPEEEASEGGTEGSEDAVEEETSDVVLTGDTEITEEDLQEIYASIKESVESEYIEPNGIDSADFSLPESAEAWSYLGTLSESYYMELFTGVEMDTGSIGNLPPSPEKEIMDSIFDGMLNGLDQLGEYDADYYSNFTQKLNPFNTNIINNVTFE